MSGRIARFINEKALFSSRPQVIFLGIYSTLEDKWYDFLDGLNRFVPVYSITDRIDNVIPSFILFLIIIVLLIAGGIFLFFGGIGGLTGIGGSGESIVTLSIMSNGQPVAGALVEAVFTCNGDTKDVAILGGNDGKASFTACTGQVNVKVSKEGYTPSEKILILPGDETKTIELLQQAHLARQITVTVQDTDGKSISTAQLSLICTSGGSPQRSQVQSSRPNNMQPSGGFIVNTDGHCDTINLEASAAGYTKNMDPLGDQETIKTITLQKSAQTGSIIFTADSPLGPQAGAQIRITDGLGSSTTLYTLASGQITQTLAAGDFTYSAFLLGLNETGSFTVEAGKTNDVIIYFSDFNADTNALISGNNAKRLYFKVVDNNSDVMMAEARIFVKNGNDWNFFTSISPQTSSVFGPIALVDANKTFKAIIKAPNHKTKLVDLQLIGAGAMPQQISLTQGGAQLTLTVKDDLGQPVLGAITKLYLNGFPLEYEVAKPTDVNGVRVINGLDSGDYKATAETTSDYGETAVHIGTANQSAVINLVTGTGTLTLHFSSDSGTISPSFIVQTSNGNAFTNFYTANATGGNATTPAIKALTQVRVISNDGNFLPYEGLVYSVKRGRQDKYIYMHRQDDLPNQNQVQLILRQVSSADPLVSAPTNTTKLMPGQSYYLLFDLIINSSAKADAKASFATAKKMPDTSSGIVFTGVEAVNSATYSFHIQDTGFGDMTSLQVDTNAVHALVSDLNRQGPIVVPIVISILVDNNTSGKTYDLNWKAQFGSQTSFEYTKKFTIGDTFCFSNCPVFAFDSFLDYQSTTPARMQVPLDDSEIKLLAGDQYSIRTKVTNLTDKDYGTGSLQVSINSPTTNMQYLSFGNPDTNFFTADVAMGAFASASAPLLNSPAKGINAKKSSGIINVYEAMKSKPGNPTVFESLSGNGDDYLKFRVSNKRNLSIDVYAMAAKNVIFEKQYYPFVFIKVTSTDPATPTQIKSPSGGYWWYYKEGEEGTKTMLPLDANGTASFLLDATSIAAGTKIIFEAIDQENSNMAHTEITVSPLFGVIPVVADCLSVKIDGNNISNISNPTINLPLPQTITNSSLSIDSNCSTDRTVTIASAVADKSQLPFIFLAGGEPPNGFTVAKGETKVITISNISQAISRGDGTAVLGYNPIKIIASGGTPSTPIQIGVIDLMVTDANSPFTLSSYVYDFANAPSNAIGATATNNRFPPAGRQDVWHPKVSISRPELYTIVNGSTVPNAPISIPVKVTTKGVEAMLMAYDAGQVFTMYQYSGWCNYYPAGIINPGPADASGTNTSTRLQSLKEASALYVAINQWYTGAKSSPAFTYIDSNERSMNPFSTLPSNVKSSIFAYQNGNESVDPQTAHPPIPSYSCGSCDGSSISQAYPPNYWVNPSPPPACYGTWTIWLPPITDVNVDTRNWNAVYDASMGISRYITSQYCAWWNCAAGYLFFNPPNRLDFSFYIRGGLVNSNYIASTWTILHEILRMAVFQNERFTTNTKTISFTPHEGQVTCANYDSTLAPVWGKVSQAPTILGHTTDAEWADSTYNLRIKNIGRTGFGFIPPEFAVNANGTAYPLPSADDPTVEYHQNNTYSKIDLNTIPPGMRVFLNKGQVCAEYIGNISQTGGSQIDFNIVRSEPLQTGYATLAVEDWVAGSATPQQQSFRVKVIGAQANCRSPTGGYGFTGKDAAPKVMYNWDWDSVRESQCDTTDQNSTYCDATQFTIGLFKKLSRIDDALLTGNEQILPQNTSFYSYLMKDNYNSAFLSDFDAYYSSSNALLSGASNIFANKLDTLITSGKLHFKLRDAAGVHDINGGLPKAGIYHVEIQFDFSNQTSPRILTSEGPQADVNVTLSLVREASLNSAIYELPFDGGLGKTGDDFNRNGYGAGPTNAPITLTRTNAVVTGISTGKGTSFAPFTFSTDSNLANLGNEIVLRYNTDTKAMEFYPAQPTPVELTVDSNGGSTGNAFASYQIKGFDGNTPLMKTWTLLASTLQNENGCLNLAGTNARFFTEQLGHGLQQSFPSSGSQQSASSGGLRVLYWTSPQDGNMSIGTVFFTPPKSNGGGNLTYLTQLIGTLTPPTLQGSANLMPSPDQLSLR